MKVQADSEDAKKEEKKKILNWKTEAGLLNP